MNKVQISKCQASMNQYAEITNVIGEIKLKLI